MMPGYSEIQQRGGNQEGEDLWVRQTILRILALGTDRLAHLHLPPVVINEKPPKHARTMFKAVALLDDVPLR